MGQLDATGYWNVEGSPGPSVCQDCADLRAQLDAANRTVEREREVYRQALEGLGRERDEALDAQERVGKTAFQCDALLAENRLLREECSRRVWLYDSHGLSVQDVDAPLTAAEVERVEAMQIVVDEAVAMYDEWCDMATGEPSGPKRRSLRDGLFAAVDKYRAALAALEADDEN